MSNYIWRPANNVANNAGLLSLRGLRPETAPDEEGDDGWRADDFNQYACELTRQLHGKVAALMRHYDTKY